MTLPKRIYQAAPDYAAEADSQEAQCFPFCFMEDSDYGRVDRIAGVWLSLGLIVTVEKTETGYRLILDHPEAVF